MTEKLAILFYVESQLTLWFLYNTQMLHCVAACSGFFTWCFFCTECNTSINCIEIVGMYFQLCGWLQPLQAVYISMFIPNSTLHQKCRMGSKHGNDQPLPFVRWGWHTFRRRCLCNTYDNWRACMSSICPGGTADSITSLTNARFSHH